MYSLLAHLMQIEEPRSKAAGHVKHFSALSHVAQLEWQGEQVDVSWKNFLSQEHDPFSKVEFGEQTVH